MINILVWVALIVGIISIVLSIFMIFLAFKFLKKNQENFEEVQNVVNDVYDKIKESLYQIDTKSLVITNDVEKSIVQLTNLFSNVFNRIIEYQNKEFIDVTDEKKLEEIMSEKNIGSDEISNQIALQLLPELIRHPEYLEKLVFISEKISKKRTF